MLESAPHTVEKSLVEIVKGDERKYFIDNGFFPREAAQEAFAQGNTIIIQPSLHQVNPIPLTLTGEVDGAEISMDLAIQGVNKPISGEIVPCMDCISVRLLPEEARRTVLAKGGKELQVLALSCVADGMGRSKRWGRIAALNANNCLADCFDDSEAILEEPMTIRQVFVDYFNKVNQSNRDLVRSVPRGGEVGNPGTTVSLTMILKDPEGKMHTATAGIGDCVNMSITQNDDGTVDSEYLAPQHSWLPPIVDEAIDLAYKTAERKLQGLGKPIPEKGFAPGLVLRALEKVCEKKGLKIDELLELTRNNFSRIQEQFITHNNMSIRANCILAAQLEEASWKELIKNYRRLPLHRALYLSIGVSNMFDAEQYMFGGQVRPLDSNTMNVNASDGVIQSLPLGKSVQAALYPHRKGSPALSMVDVSTVNDDRAVVVTHVVPDTKVHLVDSPHY